jgi:Flp pilus assembly protein TadD
MALGDDAVAFARARRAIQLAPGVAAAWALLGTLDARAGRCDEARSHLDRALALDPDEPDALRNRARLGECVSPAAPTSRPAASAP